MDPSDLALPFVTRDMLRFKQKSTYQLQIISNASANGFLYITGFTRSGTFTYKCNVSVSSSPVLQTFNLDDFPIFVSVVDKDYSQGAKGAYVELQLKMNSDVAQVLLRGYIGGYQSLTWPMVTAETGSLGQFGALATIESADPAAGAQISIGVNDAFKYRFCSFTATLVTDATVANRFVHLKVTDGLNGSSHEVASTIAQVASKTYKYHFMAGLNVPCYQENNDIFVTFPYPAYFGGSFNLVTIVTGGVAGDDWGLAEMGVEKFLGA
jgi:hypothetical protein